MRGPRFDLCGDFAKCRVFSVEPSGAEPHDRRRVIGVEVIFQLLQLAFRQPDDGVVWVAVAVEFDPGESKGFFRFAHWRFKDVSNFECASGDVFGDFGEAVFGVGHARNMSAMPTNGKDYFRHCRFIFSW